MSLTSDDIRHVASLARIAMTDEEIDKMRDEMSNILENFEILDSVDTTGVSPTDHSVELTSVMREDVTEPCLTREDALANAPLREGEFVRVRAVLE